MVELIMETDLSLPNKRKGKVRDLYDVEMADGTTALLIVATDRISAFDVVMPNGIPGKGIVLTQLSNFWFEHFGGRFPHHLMSTDVGDVPGLTDVERSSLDGRVVLCRKTNVIPIECIARGYLTGSGWKDYQQTGEVCGIELPAGLTNGDRLDEPLFTPSTKAEGGDHDVNITFDEGVQMVGFDVMRWLADTTVELYTLARDFAFHRGIILADTKFEFGVVDGEPAPLLIDEIFTPDSSRFWPLAAWQPGREQESFDKQYVRNYLETQAWDKTPPGPTLPDEVLTDTMARYQEAYERLTDQRLELS